MRIGFTATRQGLNGQQTATITWLCRTLVMTEGHHGDCIGGDAQIAGFLKHVLLPEQVIVHPPEILTSRAFAIFPGNIVRPPKDYFARNRDIVDESEILIGGPQAMEELPRGGTWQSLRYARQCHKPMVVVWPDGTFTAERIIIPLF